MAENSGLLSRFPLREHVRGWVAKLGLATIGQQIVLAVVVGIVAGVGAVVFVQILRWCEELFLVGLAGYDPENVSYQLVASGAAPSRRWVLFFVPALGGLISGFIVKILAPEARGEGTDAVVKSFHLNRAIIRPLVPVAKIFATSFTIGTGGSAGREGPIAQIGAGFSSWLCSTIKIGERQRRVLLLAGVGAGLGAVFKAPFGGAIYAIEVLYRDPEFEYEALIPTIIASTAGYSTYCVLADVLNLGTHAVVWGSIFQVPPLEFDHPVELFFYAVLAVILAIVAVLWVKVFFGVKDKIFEPLKVPTMVKPAIGGLLLGLLAYFFPAVLATSYEWLQAAINGGLPIKFLLALGFLKILATSLTIGSGGSGGVFAPCLMIGGCLGGAYGFFLAQQFPNLVGHPAAYVLVGMAGFFTGAGKVPIASLIMVSEMTEGYGLLVPLMLTVSIVYLISPSLVTIYEQQVGRRIDSRAHFGEFVIDVLESMTVREHVKPRGEITSVSHSMPLRKIFDLTTQGTQNTYPVLDPEDRLEGVVTLDLIRGYYFQPDLGQLVIAEDIVQPVVPLTEGDDLNTALREMLEADVEEYPVVDAEDTKRLVGLIRRRDVMAAYHKEMQRITKTPKP
jgi:CIC family chloride channel protein